jgi:hypothetical protein
LMPALPRSVELATQDQIVGCSGRPICRRRRSIEPKFVAT